MTDTETQQLISKLEVFLDSRMKETVAHAKNAWGSEDSKIAGIVLEKMGGHIEKAVDSRIQPLSDKLDNYIESDNEWKETAQPVIEMGKSVQGFGKVSLYILGFIASLSAGIYAITTLFKKN